MCLPYRVGLGTGKSVACSLSRWMRAATSGSTVKRNDGLFRNQCQGLISALRNLMRCTLRVKLFAIKKKKKTRERDLVLGVAERQSGLKVGHVLNSVSAVAFGGGIDRLRSATSGRSKEKKRPEPVKMQLGAPASVGLMMDQQQRQPLTEALHSSY